jgi:hypothetical protein
LLHRFDRGGDPVRVRALGAHFILAHSHCSLRHLKSGALDHVPTDLVDRIAPKLLEHYERIRNEPGVKAYYAEHGAA